MKFGVMALSKLIDRQASEPYRQLHDYLDEMEDLGYDIAYVAHHRFSATTALGGDIATEPSAPLVMLSALLARTRRMKMCTNIMLLASRHPLDVAEEINTLNELSNNRFILGAAIGYKADEFENTGWNFKTRASRFEECLEILRLALTGKEFVYKGQHFDIPCCTVVPSPMHGVTPPIWVGAVSEPAMKRAGRLGDGWLIGQAEHLVELQEKVAQYKSIAAANDRPATLCLLRDIHIAPNRQLLDPNWLPNVIKVWQAYANIGSRADRDELSNEVIFGGRQVSVDEFGPNRAIVGTPEDCIREMQRIKDLINPDYVMLVPVGVPDPEQHRKELRLFAKEVMPLFRGN